MRANHRVGLGVLILGNAMQLLAFFIWQINLHALLVVYWVELGVIGAVTGAKIRRAEGTDDPVQLPNWGYSPLGTGESRTLRSLVIKPQEHILWNFASTYAALWIFIAFPVFSLPDGVAGVEASSPFVVLAAAAGLSATHLVSYRVDFLGGREYKRKGPVTLLVEPFHRLYGLLAAIVLARTAITVAGSPGGLLAFIVGAKTYVDVRSHRREHGYDRSERDQ